MYDYFLLLFFNLRPSTIRLVITVIITISLFKHQQKSSYRAARSPERAVHLRFARLLLLGVHDVVQD